MKGLHTIVAITSTLIQGSYANKDVISLEASSDAWIQEAVATLVLGNVPNPIAGDVALWSAIMMENEASFLQGVTENALESYWCDNLGSNWCNFAYTLVDKLNSSTNLWDQNVYVDDALKSSLSTSQGQHGWLFYVSVECASGTCSAAPAHSWEDVSITLSQADPSFIHSGSWGYGATGGEMSSSDNGRTWNFTTLYVPETAIN
ncbi:hypothetical protein G7054_g12830 [Neopestalotiopsis clavispora]|nr:hypothetical protein G7054_g12830 [Neopestalotiopsis clavispora]